MAKQIITDEESILKRQARRRLIGAIALTILVVVLLPMILDSEPPAPKQDIDLQIPDKDNAGEFLPKMVLPPSTSSTSPVSQEVATPVPVPAPLIAPLLDSKATPATPKIEANSTIQASPKVETAPKAEPVSKVEPVPKVEAAPKVISNPAKSKSAETSVAKSHSGYIIQIGAFANATAAKDLQVKLHKQNYPSYTEKVGDKTRVRIGVYATHTEAEKMRRKLEIQGYKPDVINLK